MSQLTITLDAGMAADEEDRDRLIRSLRRDLLESDLVSVELRQSQAAPIGSKGGIGPLGSLHVTVASGAAMPLAGRLQQWLATHEKATLTLGCDGQTVTLTGTLPSEQKGSIEALLSRCTSTGKSDG